MLETKHDGVLLILAVGKQSYEGFCEFEASQLHGETLSQKVCPSYRKEYRLILVIFTIFIPLCLYLKLEQIFKVWEVNSIRRKRSEIADIPAKGNTSRCEQYPSPNHVPFPVLPGMAPDSLPLHYTYFLPHFERSNDLM